jgi:hypothetical protein
MGISKVKLEIKGVRFSKSIEINPNNQKCIMIEYFKDKFRRSWGIFRFY